MGYWELEHEIWLFAFLLAVEQPRDMCTCSLRGLFGVKSWQIVSRCSKHGFCLALAAFAIMTSNLEVWPLDCPQETKLRTFGTIGFSGILIARIAWTVLKLN